MDRLRGRAPEVVVVLGAVLLGALDLRGTQQPFWQVLFGVLLAVAGALFRRAPGTALALVWLASVLQVSVGLPLGVEQLVIVVVAFGTARYGSPAVVWVSGLSMPVGAVIALVYVQHQGIGTLLGVGQVVAATPLIRVTPVLLAASGLALPWVLGLLLRVGEQYRRSREERAAARAEAARAEELARLRAEQTRLARDVHDVVGHSLAVIVAQADSAQYLGDDVDRMRTAMDTIAASARQSLSDVRQVLTATDGAAPPTAPGDLDGLVEGVRAAGNEVDDRVSGRPRALAEDVDLVAYRTLQEMLTNALKHGRSRAPLSVDRRWGPADLVIEVRNVADPVPTDPDGGLGLPNMRRRVESVGGRLDVRRETNGTDTVFTATASLPAPGGLA